MRRNDAEFLSLLLDAYEDKNFDRESNLCVQQCIFKVIENLPVATFIINREGRVVFWNQAIEELTGVKKSQILGRGNYAYAVPFFGIPRPMLVDCFFSGNEVLKKWYKSITRRGDKLYTRVFCPLLNNGRGAFIWAAAFPLKDSKGQVIGAVESIRDITEQLQLKKMLQESTLKFKTLFNSTNDAVFLYELKDGSKASYFFEVNDVACKKLGYTREELCRMTPDNIRDTKFLPGTKENIKKFFKENYIVFETACITKKGTKIPVEITAHLFAIEGKKVVLEIVRDITEFKCAEAMINQVAYYDTLTGLPNKTLFIQHLSNHIDHSLHTKNLLAVMLLHIDWLKTIAPSGPDMESQLIKAVVHRLKKISPENDCMARINEEKFALLIKNVQTVEDIIPVIKKIQEAFNQPFIINKNKLYVMVNMGVVVFPGDGNNAETLIKNAEIAVHAAIEEKTTNYRLFNASLNQKTYEYIELDYRLSEALKHNELLLYYQPIFDLNNYKIVGAEALLRWKHPTLGMVSPDKFIPIAEKRGLIIAIGRWVLHNACLQGVTWKQEGLPELRISVNISVHQFEQNNLVEVVSGILKETKFNPFLLQLEITESVSMKNPRDNMNMLADLRKMGIHIALDDFGTGYSSLSYLTWLSLDALKIDRSLINALPTSKNNVAIVEAIIEMAHQLGIKVTAEGVEIKEQVRILKDKGCDYAQGYFFSKPLPSQEFKKFVLKSQ